MQTFLPYRSFEQSAKCLDYRRLGKQRVETLQILNKLLGESAKAGWSNHPAVLMWKGHEGALFAYMVAMCNEWSSRGYNNEAMEQHIKVLGKKHKKHFAETATLPEWYGKRKLHASHRSNLLRKDRKFYSRFKWQEKDNLEYFWPVRIEKPRKD